jgi:hypothetical protein
VVNGQLHVMTTLPHGTNPGTHWIAGWVGPIARLDIVPSLEPRIFQHAARTTLSQRPTKITGLRREALTKRGQVVITEEQRSICWVGLRKTKNEASVRMTGLQAKIWTTGFMNKK